MVLGVVRPEMAVDSWFHEVEQMLDEGLSLDSSHTDLGTIKNSPDCLLDRNYPCDIT